MPKWRQANMDGDSTDKQQCKHSPHKSSPKKSSWDDPCSSTSFESYWPSKPYSTARGQNSYLWDQSEPTSSGASKMGTVFSRLDCSRDEAEKSGPLNPVMADGASSDPSSDPSISKLTPTDTPVFLPDNSANTLLHKFIPMSTRRARYQTLQRTDGVILPPYHEATSSIHYIAPAHARDEYPFYWTILEDEQRKLKAYEEARKSRHREAILLTNGYRLSTLKRHSDMQRHQVCRKCLSSKKNIKGDKICRSHRDPNCMQDDKGNKIYPCCNKFECCEVYTTHQWGDPPPIFEDHYNAFIESSRPSPADPKRKAIVLDCEMVGIIHGLSELARLCVVDYVSGEILIDCFVDPIEQVEDWRSRYSGINERNMIESKKRGNCLPNWRAARSALLKFIDTNTIIIGHAPHNDLEILRLVHTEIVDTSIVSQQKIASPWNRKWALKTMCKEILNLDIQVSSHGHNPVEDCMATRELLLWMTLQDCTQFEAWAAMKRYQEEEQYLIRQQKELEKQTGITGASLMQHGSMEGYGVSAEASKGLSIDGASHSDEQEVSTEIKW